jgi:hypothetical protein
LSINDLPQDSGTVITHVSELFDILVSGLELAFRQKSGNFQLQISNFKFLGRPTPSGAKQLTPARKATNHAL